MMTTLYILGGIAFLAAFAFGQVPLARHRAASRDLGKVDILWGVAQLVVWKKNEIVIFERNGSPMDKLLKLDIKDRIGGSRLITAWLGESIGPRMRLYDQRWDWQGTAPTRGGIRCHVEVQIKSAINIKADADDNAEVITTYAYGNEAARRLNEKGEINARMVAEELFGEATKSTVRATLSHESIYEMIILTMPEYRADGQGSQASEVIDSSVEKISRKLADNLQEQLRQEAEDHGLRLRGVVASIKFEDEVMKKALQAFISSFEPLQAKHLAESIRIMKETEIEIDGKRLNMYKELFDSDSALILEMLERLRTKGKINQDQLLKIFVALKGWDPQAIINVRQPDKIGPSGDERES